MLQIADRFFAPSYCSEFIPHCICRDRGATLRSWGGGGGGNDSDSILGGGRGAPIVNRYWGGHKTPFLTNSL